jgi:hypothetical protein
MTNQAVAKIELAFSNGPMGFPVGWVVLACGHTAKLVLRDASRSAHDVANQITRVGDEVQCERCDWYAEKLAKIRAMSPGDVSHARFRTRDSRGFGAGDYYVYGRVPSSPTGVHLLFSIEATPEAYDALRALRASPLSPTEKR